MNKQNTKSNFGKWGWSMILYCAISYYLAAALATDGINYYPAAFGELRKWGTDFVDMCNAATGIGGFLAVITAAVFAAMTSKLGSKWMAVIGNAVSGLLTIVFALTGEKTVFLAMVVLIACVTGNIQLNFVPNTIMNVWFPKKKGLALGWASMGLPICTATIIVIFTKVIGDPVVSYLILAGLFFAFAVASLFWAKDTPEQVGATPDNEPLDQKAAAAMKKAEEEQAKKLTVKSLLKNRNVWAIGVGLGLLWMTTLGLVSNFLVRLSLTAGDVTEAGAPNVENFVVYLTIAAVVGIVGSYIWGWLDQKLGTKKASLIYGAWYVVALLLMIFLVDSPAMYAVTAFFIGFGIGGIGNLIPSMIGTCFGRFGFAQANRVVAPINALVRSLAFIIIGAVGTEFLTASYVIFLVGTVLAIGIICLIKEPKRD